MPKHSHIIRAVVADSARARFFTLSPQGEQPTAVARPYMALHATEHEPLLIETTPPLAAEKGRSNPAVRHDMGRSFESASSQRHIIAAATDDKTLDRAAFATRIATRLQDDFARNRFDRLILVAPAPMLGQLRQHLPDTLPGTHIHTLCHEWTALSAEDIRHRLAAESWGS